MVEFGSDEKRDGSKSDGWQIRDKWEMEDEGKEKGVGKLGRRKWKKEEEENEEMGGRGWKISGRQARGGKTANRKTVTENQIGVLGIEGNEEGELLGRREKGKGKGNDGGGRIGDRSMCRVGLSDCRTVRLEHQKSRDQTTKHSDTRLLLANRSWNGGVNGVNGVQCK